MVCPDEESFLKYHSFIWEQKGYRNGARFLVRTEMKEDEATPYNHEIFDKIVKHIDQLSSIEETEALFADEWEKRIVTVNEKRQIREIDRTITVGELTSAEVLNREMEEYTAVSLGDITLPMLGEPLSEGLSESSHMRYLKMSGIRLSRTGLTTRYIPASWRMARSADCF